MHEFSLVESILECAFRVAHENGDLPIQRVDLEIGALQQVLPEALLMAFDAAKQGTAAEHAELTWTAVPLRVECAQCGGVYMPHDPPWVCPECNAVGGRTVSGDELLVKSVELLDE
jgi:hydrogenase nickel incorporation protein HypA/HybF